MSKFKTVTIPLVVPAGYKWVARQPYGTWHAFKRKPKVHVAYEDRSEDGFVPKYWATQDDEIELAVNDHGADGNREFGKWRQTLRRI